ncbi:MAG: hypothetical protein LBO09_07265 [Candidatus Peribacteria bacterium]|jgi:hypothetical protein|nr:hypothetical protein [Candidatus Peribacteria bacterium]
MKTKNLIVVVGLIVFLGTGCTDPPKAVEGKPICWAEKYGVNFSRCGESNYLFSVSSGSCKDIALTLANAQILFESTNPDLEFVNGCVVGSGGNCLVATYVARTSPIFQEGDAYPFHKKYGVEFASSGKGRYLFYDHNHSSGESVAPTVFAAKAEFEKEHPNLMFVCNYVVGASGDCLVVNYRAKPPVSAPSEVPSPAPSDSIPSE